VFFPFDRFPVKRDLAVPALLGISCFWVYCLTSREPTHRAVVIGNTHTRAVCCDLWDY